jgi:pseudouridine synthase
MRINAFVAEASGLSRRAADRAITEQRVQVNGQPANIGQAISPDDRVTLDDKLLEQAATSTTILLNKPTGYVCSRDGQGNPAIYDLLPAKYHHLKPVGRLDKDSSGLLLLTDDGQLANRLTHPRYSKTKAYEVKLDKPLANEHLAELKKGVKLEDGLSKLQISSLNDKDFTVTMTEGRNRQIRRTFAALGYTVTDLRRTRFGDYILDGLPIGQQITA